MSVLQRKAQVGKQEHQARAMTVPKALRVALAKVADQSLNMALAVIGVKQESWPGDEIEAKSAGRGLLVLLDGPGATTGGVVMDAALVNALVQHQTTGRFSGIVAQERVLTATDAALCAPLLDALFSRTHGLLETPADRDVLPCYKFGARAENARLFALALSQAEYRVFSLTIDICAGKAQATVQLILPIPEVRSEVVDDLSGEATATGGQRTLEHSVMGLSAELAAVLCKIKLSLSQMSTLSPGDILSVPMEAFDAVELQSLEGRTLARGAMGQLEGKRALMISLESGARKQGGSASAAPDSGEEPVDYSTLDFPELEIPSSPKIITPDADESLPDLPDLPDLPELHGEDSSDFDPADLPDLSDLPDLPDLPDLSQEDDDLPDIGDLPKLNIA